jgi:hypothetical protein
MIITQSVGPGNPYAFTTATGTSAQAVVPSSGVGVPILALGGAFLNGRPFQIHLGGYVKSHGTSQTMQVGIQAQAYSSSTFSGTSLGLTTASGSMTAGSYYPFRFVFDGICDVNSQVFTGAYWGYDGVTPTLKTPTITPNLITSINWGTFSIASGNVANPLASASAYALQFAPQITNGVSDTSTIYTITDFHVSAD